MLSPRTSARRTSASRTSGPVVASQAAVAALGPAAVPLPARPVLADEISLADLSRFKGLMAAEGQTVHVARMCYDRPYAFERIAQAHASAHDPLRRQALTLFQAYHRRDEARLLND